MSLRQAIAGRTGRLVGSASRLIGFGAGEAVTGKLAHAIDPTLFGSLVRRVPQGFVVVMGTNGKTSTAAMLTRVLRAAHRNVVTNATGANLVGGVVGALLKQRGADIGVLEVDEAAARSIVPTLRPNLMIWTNVLRDQLDRYYETDIVLNHLENAAKDLEGPLVVNADDPGLVGAAERSGKRVVYYGLTHARDTTTALAADSANCAKCGAPLTYEARYLGHLGRYSCDACGWKRPEPDVAVTPVELKGAQRLTVRVDGIDITLHTGGLGAAYNVGATIAAAEQLGVGRETTAKALEGMTAVFGRGETIGKGVLLLMKNPAGGNEGVMQTLEDGFTRFLIAINDRSADGVDVSWLWDVEFERLKDVARYVVVSGDRAADMAVRLKYAGVRVDVVEPDLRKAVTAIEDEPFAFLATYTAMLEARAAIRGKSQRLHA
jgi:UDP-N-acetylmuramyl tripeptide synthase